MAKWTVLISVLVLLNAFTVMNALGQDRESASDNKETLTDAQMYALNNNVSTEEAIRRFQLQGIAGKLGAELRDNETETFAGLWIEHKPKFKIVVLFTQDGEETIKPYLKQYVELADIAEVRTANVSLANLQKDQEDLSSAISALGIPANSGVNVYNNSVELYITKGDMSRFDDALQRKEMRMPSTVRVIMVEALAEPAIGTSSSTAQARPELP